MRMIFGVMSLLIVLAIVGTIGKKQLQALGQFGGTAARTPTDADGKAAVDALMGRARDGAATVAVPRDMGAMAGAVDAAPAVVEGSLPAQSRAIQGNVRDATNAALQKGVDRANTAQP